jgi:4-diphosphocytidyl-2-C-methyl-D-erythritol kinase
MTSVRAYAKINIGLFVLRKRSDGYHDIETIFHRIDLFDELEFAPADRIVVECSDPTLPTDERNICFKTAQRLRKHFGIREGVKLTIRKNIPVGAGLGGGSSDAAAVLIHLPSFWGKTMDTETRHAIGAELGSDVPYFLTPGSAVGKGRGEILDHFTLKMPFAILLCNPGIHISTPWAYGHVRPKGRDIAIRTIVEEGIIHPPFSPMLTNDFEEPVFAAHPPIAQIKNVLNENGSLLSLMSGSGSSVFGLFDDSASVIKAEKELRRSGWRTFLTHPGFQPA